MTHITQMKILNLYKGKSFKRACIALETMQSFTDNKRLALRIKIVGLPIGDKK